MSQTPAGFFFRRAVDILLIRFSIKEEPEIPAPLLTIPEHDQDIN
jgi:hypothetical protein